MSVFQIKRFCIIGPSPSVKYLGGVATHIKNLKSLSCFQYADIIDIGSANSNFKKGYFEILYSLFSLFNRVRIQKYKHILVNSSIYPSSLLKLLIMLSVLPGNKHTVVDVFFHGGRFSFLNSNTAFLLRIFFRFALLKVRYFYFLSNVQRDGFMFFFPGYPSRLYANYATSDDIWSSKRHEKEGCLQLLFVGRVVREKGVYELVSAVKELIEGHVKVRLTIVGDGPDLSGLIKFAGEFNSESIRFLGYLSGQSLEMAYRDADLLVFPTYHPEGFPYVVIEAMRAGVPIISTSSGALDNLVVGGVTGFKVPERDVEALVSTIKALSKNRPLINEMSQNCHDYFKKHLNKSAAERFYSNLLESSV
ncbi:glycosyltransferase family 4 protein [Desulfomicrobium norvegicum]|uniref:glycosyltransferase family 4 protein n=1 Tax=Desulfomicrobium norvegicum (strain DSM 1741 / NCIMB 8310) TaxID=52561 RepID=UPI001160DCAA|nr:glycosyltransferase family 4 protein [Desulfomicrobium norvegicum]